jgi:hypothetical protein
MEETASLYFSIFKETPLRQKQKLDSLTPNNGIEAD